MQRRFGPFQNGEAPYVLAINRNKQGIVLNLKDQRDLLKAYRIIAGVDVLLENWRPGVANRLRLDFKTAKMLNPRLIYCSALGYGQTGPYSHKPSMDMAIADLSGLSSISGSAGGPGERPRFTIVDFSSPIVVCQTILLALLMREQTGTGLWVQCSQLQSTLFLQISRFAEYFATNRHPVPMGSACPNMVPAQAFKTRDDYIFVEILTDHQWEAFCEALNLPHLLSDNRFGSNEKRVQHRAQLLAALDSIFLSKSTSEWVKALTPFGIPCGRRVLTLQELEEDPQVQQGRLILHRRHRKAGLLKLPGVPWRFSKTPASIRSLGPLLGEHTHEVLKELGKGRIRKVTSRKVAPPSRASAPLHRIRVIDLTQGDGAPCCAMQLGDAGAQVIKVESLDGDWARRLGPPFVGRDSALFHSLNRNKKSLAVQFNSPHFRHIMVRLLKQADVLVLNDQVPGVPEWLTRFSSLARFNPKLILCHIRQFDQQGPYKHLPSSELVMQGLAGVTRFLGEHKGEPVRLGINYCGMLTSLYAVAGILAALYWRNKSAQGQKVTLSTHRCVLASQANYFAVSGNLDQAVQGFPTHHLEPPATGYKTKDGRISFYFPVLRNPDPWPQFCRLVGVPGRVIEDPRFTTERSRRQHYHELQKIYEAAFRDRTAEELLEILDSLDVLSAPVNDYSGVNQDPQVRHENMIVDIGWPPTGANRAINIPWKIPLKKLDSISLAAPTIGQHSEEVLRWAGFTRSQIKKFKAEGIIPRLPTTTQ